jgi:hypothetical protein
VREYLLLTFEFGTGEEKRVLTLTAQGERYEQLLRALLNSEQRAE